MVDREALPKGPPVVDFVNCDSPTLAAPADAADPANAAGAAPAGEADAAGAAPASELTTAEMLERVTEELRVRRAEAQADWEVLREAAACAEEDQEVRRRLEAENAAWRRQQAQEQAAQAAHDARMAELSRILAN